MNRRSFLSSLLKGVVSAAILPSAVTYTRTWKTADSGLIIPRRSIIPRQFFFPNDVARYSLLPFYFTKTVINNPNWKEFDKLFGDIPWQENKIIKTI